QAGASDSSILVIAAGGGSDSILAMPPKGEGDRLTREQVKLIARWIDAGAKAPAGEVAAVPKSRSAHWAFQPVQRPPLPTVKEARWVRNPIDRFILARLEKEDIAPAAEADRP